MCVCANGGGSVVFQFENHANFEGLFCNTLEKIIFIFFNIKTSRVYYNIKVTHRNEFCSQELYF